MTSIYPRCCKYGKTDRDDRIADIEIIEDFAECEQNIADIVSPEYRKANPSEMKSIGTKDEGKCRKMMYREFEEVFSWFLKLKGQYDE
jgi:hypothetical protein